MSQRFGGDSIKALLCTNTRRRILLLPYAMPTPNFALFPPPHHSAVPNSWSGGAPVSEAGDLRGSLETKAVCGRDRLEGGSLGSELGWLCCLGKGLLQSTSRSQLFYVPNTALTWVPPTSEGREETGGTKGVAPQGRWLWSSAGGSEYPWTPVFLSV